MMWWWMILDNWIEYSSPPRLAWSKGHYCPLSLISVSLVCFALFAVYGDFNFFFFLKTRKSCRLWHLARPSCALIYVRYTVRENAILQACSWNLDDCLCTAFLSMYDHVLMYPDCRDWWAMCIVSFSGENRHLRPDLRFILFVWTIRSQFVCHFFKNIINLWVVVNCLQAHFLKPWGHMKNMNFGSNYIRTPPLPGTLPMSDLSHLLRPPGWIFWFSN